MVLVTGATGFVGSAILKAMEGAIACPSLRNASLDDVKRMICESDVDTIIHTAAISDMGECERDPEASYHANVLVPTYLAQAAEGRKLICFSSDQVYNDCETEGPYDETYVKPGNVYAKHKLEMENRVLDLDCHAVMLRAEWMYDHYTKKSNYFMNLMGNPKSVFASAKQFRGITYLKEVVQNMPKVLELPGGAYNFGSEVDKSFYEITKAYVQYLGKDIEVVDCPPHHNLWMDCSKAKGYGVVFSDVLDALKMCTQDNRFRG